MQRHILLMITLGTSIAWGDTAKVILTNWSKNYTMEVLLASGKWLPMEPKTRRINAIVNPETFIVRACPAKGPKPCYPKGLSTTIDIRQHIRNGNTNFVLDAGNTFFAGLSTESKTTSTAVRLSQLQKPSMTKTIRILPLMQQEPLASETARGLLNLSGAE